MRNKRMKVMIGVVLASSLLACNFLAGATPPATSLPSPLPAIEQTSTPPSTDLPAQILVTETPESTPISSPTSNEVIVSVVKESLFIRRGPGTAYDALDIFVAGKQAVASYRDAYGNWVYVPLFINPSVHGWVSIKTEYSSVQGDVSSLDEMKVDPAIPISIRNCTFHPMLIKPGDVLIKPQVDTPNNVKFFPAGSYSAYDQSQMGHPLVASFTLGEGGKIDINKDGIGNTYTCP